MDSLALFPIYADVCHSGDVIHIQQEDYEAAIPLHREMVKQYTEHIGPSKPYWAGFKPNEKAMNLRVIDDHKEKLAFALVMRDKVTLENINEAGELLESVIK